MKTFKLLALILTIALCTFSCQSNIEGEGNATFSEEIKIQNFDKLVVECNCNLILIPAEEPKIIIESHQNIIENAVVHSNSKKLIINEKKEVKDFDLYNVMVYFSKEINEINLEENTKMNVAGVLKSEELKLKIADRSEINQSAMEIRDFELKAEGHTKVNINGSGIQVKIKASDHSKINLSDFKIVDADFEAKDNSELNLNVMKTLNGKASNHSKVVYEGNPVKNISEKDLANVRQK